MRSVYGASARGLHDKAVAVASRFDERLASGEEAAEGDDADDRARDRADGDDADDRARDRADGDDAARPSVLFVMADQWRADYDGFHPAVATLELPHLSALAARGVRCAANAAPDRDTLLLFSRPLMPNALPNILSRQRGQTDRFYRRFRRGLAGEDQRQGAVLARARLGRHGRPVKGGDRRTHSNQGAILPWYCRLPNFKHSP